MTLSSRGNHTPILFLADYDARQWSFEGFCTPAFSQFPRDEEVKKELEGGGFETVWENPLDDQYLQAYMLSQVLSVYGRPEQVLIFANEGWRYFSLILDYSDQGFAIWYSAPLESSGDQYVGCMSKAFTRLYLWTPEFAYSWAEGITGTGNRAETNSLNRNFRPLEDATSLTLDEFYNIFMKSDNVDCLQTSKELWPGP